MPTLLQIALSYQSESGYPVADYGLGRIGNETNAFFKKWVLGQPAILAKAHFVFQEERGRCIVVINYPEEFAPYMREAMHQFALQRQQATLNRIADLKKNEKPPAIKIPIEKRKRQRISPTKKPVYSSFKKPQNDPSPKA